MRKLRTIFLFGLNALGIGVSLATATAQEQNRCEINPEEAECACERALELGTIEALEDYLFRYPDAPTACQALALNTLSQFSPRDEDDPPVPTDTSGYGG